MDQTTPHTTAAHLSPTMTAKSAPTTPTPIYSSNAATPNNNRMETNANSTTTFTATTPIHTPPKTNPVQAATTLRQTPTSITSNVDANLPPTSPKLTPSDSDLKVPSPYRRQSFRLRTNSPERKHHTTPPRAMTAPRPQKHRISPYRSNSFKLKKMPTSDDEHATTFRRRINNRDGGVIRRIHLSAQPSSQSQQNDSFRRSLQTPGESENHSTPDSSRSLFSRRSLLFSGFDDDQPTTPTRHLGIPFFDSKIAGSSRAERQKKVGTFEAIFEGRNTDRSPSQQSAGDTTATESTTDRTTKKDSSSTKVPRRPKIKVAFETTQRRISATVTGATKTTFPNSNSGIFGSSSIGFGSSNSGGSGGSGGSSDSFSSSVFSRSDFSSRAVRGGSNSRVISARLKSKLPTSPLAAAARRALPDGMESLVLNPSPSSSSSNTPVDNTDTDATEQIVPPPPVAPTNVLYFQTGVLRHNLLDVNDNLIELKNTMTVTGRTAIKRVFPEVKNGLKIEINGQNVALYRNGDVVYAVGTECPHRKGPLHLGDIEDVEKHGMCVVCPWHRWTFRLTDGVLVKPDRGDRKAVVYPVMVDAQTDEISIGFEEFGNNLFNGFDDEADF